MTRAKYIMGALGPRKESRQPTGQPKRADPIPAPRDQLVRVSLVAHIPDDRFPGRFEHAVKGDGQLDRSEACPEVASVCQADRKNLLAHVLSQVHHLLEAHLLDLLRGLNGIRGHGWPGWNNQRCCPKVCNSTPWA